MNGTWNRVVRGIVFVLVILLTVHCTARPESSTKPALTPLPAEEFPENMSLTIVYDNNAYDPRLRTEWGFACWVQYGETILLFDTGGDGSILLNNLSTLGLVPQDVDVVVLSHIHGDHTGGMESLLGTGVRPDVYVPVTFPTRYKNQLRELVTVHEVSEPQEILPGIYTTGKMGVNIPEQGLVLKTTQGLVVITGCAHPGIAQMVRRAKDVGQDDIHLVLGGFHLGGASPAQVRQICETFRELGVQSVAPCHCTGERAMEIFATEFGDDYVAAGVGWGTDLRP
jgi:7,8-dihydropterin-6-yl-methyl-4-(beta-D-ribofuranosyl)aminobenzene 5'-phosphate synthase